MNFNNVTGIKQDFDKAKRCPAVSSGDTFYCANRSLTSYPLILNDRKVERRIVSRPEIKFTRNTAPYNVTT